MVSVLEHSSARKVSASESAVLADELFTNQQLDILEGCEPSHYLSVKKWGYFSHLSRQKGRSRAVQKSYPLRDLPDVIRLINSSTAHYDHWISQGVFRVPNRRKINLAHISTLWCDLDYYHIPELAGYEPEAVANLVLQGCEHEQIPDPSLMLYSGNGLQVKWFHEPLPQAALARWDAVQKELVMRFRQLGADGNARDASRVLRLEDTINQKTGDVAQVIYVNTQPYSSEPVRYTFSKLADGILPYTQAQIQELREKYLKDPAYQKAFGQKNNVIHKNSFARSLTVNSLNWQRACDIRKLRELRGGDMGDGLRESAAFWCSNFYCLRYFKDLATRPLEDWSEIHEIFRLFGPHWDHKIARVKASALFRKVKETAAGRVVTWQGQQFPPLYTPHNETLIEKLEITPAEQRELSTIIGNTEYKRRDALRDEKRRRAKGVIPREEYIAQGYDKAAQAQKLKAQGRKNKEIAKIIGVHVKSVSRYLKKKVTSPSA